MQYPDVGVSRKGVVEVSSSSVVLGFTFVGVYIGVEFGLITTKDKYYQLDQNHQIEQEPKYNKRKKLWKHIQCQSLN